MYVCMCWSVVRKHNERPRLTEIECNSMDRKYDENESSTVPPKCFCRVEFHCAVDAPPGGRFIQNLFRFGLMEIYS